MPSCGELSRLRVRRRARTRRA